MIKRRRRFKRWDLLRQVRLAATYVADIFAIVVALIGALAIVLIQIRRDKRDRSAAAKSAQGSSP